MVAVILTHYKYARIDNPSDVTTFPLIRGLVGLNNRIYATLGSYGFEKDDEQYKKLRAHFSEEELRFGCLVRLFELHLVVRTYANKNEYKEHVVDFKEVYDKVKKLKKRIDKDEVQLYMSLHDDGDKSDKQLGVLHIPLGSDVFKNAANYAYQEIEKMKMDNFMSNLSESEQLSKLIRIF